MNERERLLKYMDEHTTPLTFSTSWWTAMLHNYRIAGSSRILKWLEVYNPELSDIDYGIILQKLERLKDLETYEPAYMQEITSWP